jgi:SAM-dependent methyltransferase
VKRGFAEPYYIALEHRPSQILWKDREKEFDRKFGVDTAGTIPLSALDVNNENWEYGFSYQATDPTYFRVVLDELPIAHEEFTFVDFGSGKGRVLLLAADFPFRKILGVEISQRLHKIAEQNIRNYRNPAVKCAMMQSFFADAATYPIPDGRLVLYFFNPFEREIMVKVLSNIDRSLREQPREIYVVYRTPLLGSLMDQATFLKKVSARNGYAVYASVYFSRPI